MQPVSTPCFWSITYDAGDGYEYRVLCYGSEEEVSGHAARMPGVIDYQQVVGVIDISDEEAAMIVRANEVMQ